MSEENIELVRELYACVRDRDWDRVAELVDPNVEQHPTVGGLEQGLVARGLDELRELYLHVDDVWSAKSMAVERLFAAGDRVVAFQREFQRGRSSGLELVAETAAVIDLRDGRVVRMQGYMDRAAALAAAGLSEQATR